ncbi:MAG: hypothetical protein EXR72_04075 [Myxococcales bacterium]|nr:hypothetical protein [Myxococcales bacterium]
MIGACHAGWGDCNKNGADGCEANLHVDIAHCAGCGMVCAIPCAVAACADGCYMAACEFGWDDCNGDAKDGCEVSVLDDLKNCGACGKVCAAVLHGKNQRVLAACPLTQCDAGYADCNATVKDGCEVSIATDKAHRGGCGKSCAQNQVCIDGACTCPPCNFPNALSACVNNLCALRACVQGFGDCDGQPANGCERPLSADVANCGACGKACAQGLVCINGGCTCQQCMFPNAKSSCVSNLCMLDACLQGFGDCNGNAQDGCETKPTSDAKNCNGRGIACPMNKMNCVNGACTDVPATPFFDSMPLQTGSTSRGAGSPCGTLLTANQNANVVAIAINVNITLPTNIKFMIWTHPAHVLVYFSPPKQFASGSGWMKSDPFPAYLLQAGMSYDVGGTADQQAIYYYDTKVETMNGITSLSQNPNWTNYAMPVMGGHAGVDCAVQLV